MSQDPSKASAADEPPQAYQAAMADIEERAARGDLSIAEVKREIFALRERFSASADVVMRWAAHAHADGGTAANPPLPIRGVGLSAVQDGTPDASSGLASSASKQPA